MGVKSLNLFLSLVLLVPALSFGREPIKRHTTLLDYLTSGDFSCSVQSKRVLKPGSISGESGLLGQDPVCLVGVSCSPVAGVTAKVSQALHNCKAPRGVCEELLDCARDEALPKSTSSNPEWASLPLVKEDKEKNKLNDTCVSLTKSKERNGAFQFYDGSALSEQVCVTRYSCSQSPAVDVVACPTLKGKAGEVMCPRINGCIDSQIAMPAGFTELELKRISDTNPGKEKLLRAELAKPATVVTAESQKPPGNAVSSTSFQPRTANVIGSRTSVSNPPASKPPASGHTGRGMK